MLSDILNKLGWQGGTVHQALREIERLKKIEHATKELMNDLALLKMQGKFKPSVELLEVLQNVNNAFEKSL